MLLLSHVTVEIPIHHLESATRWYESRLHLTLDKALENEVRFSEGVYLLGARHWESHSTSLASFTLVVGAQFDDLVAILAPTGELIGDTFHTQDPWGNKIQLRRSQD
jgi:catechol-2,3-dioxygenase